MQHIHYFVAGQAQGVPIPVVIAIDRIRPGIDCLPSNVERRPPLSDRL